jgi:hypothetical protein
MFKYCTSLSFIRRGLEAGWRQSGGLLYPAELSALRSDKGGRCDKRGMIVSRQATMTDG